MITENFLHQTVETKKRKHKKKYFFLSLFLVVILCIGYFSLLLLRPLQEDISIKISKGNSLTQVSNLLSRENLAPLSTIPKVFFILTKQTPKSGFYLFKKGENFFDIVNRLSKARYGDIYETITIPEGSTNEDIISILKQSPFTINEEKLRNLIEGQEGFLFPDTYFFLPTANEQDIVQELEKTFEKNIQKVERGKTIEKNRHDIVTMASLLEKESANDLHQKQIISGILWKRISIGMPLQVDATFLYERGKGSAQLSHKDLETDSPYNTYTNKGLPPTPIGNPGYDALYAATHPLPSDYWYYLHDKNGQVHYAKNHQEHIRNIRQYLK